MRGAARHLDAYRREANGEQTRDRALERVHAMDTAPAEDAAIAEAERNIGELNAIEQAGVDPGVLVNQQGSVRTIGRNDEPQAPALFFR